MSTLVTPQMFTDPVVGQDFFGRDENLKLLLKRSLALRQGYRQNIAILGPELIGKSSLLQHFMLRFEDSETLVVCIELRTQEPFEEFATRFVTNVLHSFLKKVGSECHEADRLRAFQKHAPKTALWIKSLLEKKPPRNQTESFVTLLEIPSRLWKETGKYVILILDEFDRLLELGVEEPFAVLGKQIMVQKETMYLVASSQMVLARMILRQRLSLLFGHFETITLEPFNPPVALDYLEKKWYLTALDSQAKQFLISLTGGHPFYLNVMGQHLSTYPSSELRNPSKSVIPVLEKVLFSAQGILGHYFTKRVDHILSSDHSGKSLVILQALSKRAYSFQEIRALFKSAKDLRSKLTRLTESGILSRHGVFFRITDRLFAFWLESCFKRKVDVLTRNISEQSSAFRNEAEETMKWFTEQLKKDPHEKIMDLFTSFRGEAVEIDQKTHRLPRFSDVRLYNGKKGELLIIGNKDKGSWVTSFFEHEVTEEDVSEFLRQCDRLNRTIHQKVLIPAGGIHENARLLAKKERLWTWELENVNMLLDIFGHGPVLTAQGDWHG